MDTRKIVRLGIAAVACAYVPLSLSLAIASKHHPRHQGPPAPPEQVVNEHVQQMIEEGRRTFRFDTFGDEDFWGGVLHLHDAIQGERFGGVGPGVSPRTALAVGLKVDVDALPRDLREKLRKGRVNLDDPATTLALMRLNAVVGITGVFDGGRDHLRAIGIQCALCHSTVDNSLAPGVGHRLDGWANRDLNVGAIVALSPNLQPVADLLHTNVTTVKTVLGSWGPGKFDAELFLDGKAFRPDGGSAATLIPPAFGLAGVNLHTWVGWGSVTHWNAFVAVLEMHGHGTFFDPRLDDATQFPIAAENRMGHVTSVDDRVTAKLPALHFYQLSLPAPAPPSGSFDEAAAERGDALFGGKARCTSCHTDELYSEPGWNLHRGEDLGIDDFQADRGPDHRYRTSPLKGLWTHTKGGFFHDGRFATLLDVVNHYDAFFHLGLTDAEKHDLVEYLKSLGDDVPPSVRSASTLNAGVPVESATEDAGETPAPASLTLNPSLVPPGGSVDISLAIAGMHGLPGDLQAAVYDIAGRRVAELTVAPDASSGSVALRWDTRDTAGHRVGPGVYFVRAAAASVNFRDERRLVIR